MHIVAALAISAVLAPFGAFFSFVAGSLFEDGERESCAVATLISLILIVAAIAASHL